MLPEALRGLAEFKQFIVFRLAPKPNGKTDKIPINPVTGGNCTAHDPAAWMSYDQAAAYGQGVGFVFTRTDPFFFVDIDGCLLPNGQWSDTATQICAMFPGAAVEVSQSNTGLHIIGRGTAPENHPCKNIQLDLEVYTHGRFVALTGTSAVGDVNTEHSAALGQFLATYMPQGSRMSANDEEWTTEPADGYTGPEDDKALIDKMLGSKSASALFGNAASVTDLWNAELDKLAECYPDMHGDRPYDASSADAALCSHLAFWTGKNCERMDRLFRQSELMREKWGSREDYRRATILKAVAGCRNIYNAEKEKKDKPSGYKYLTCQDQEEYFKGCVYIADVDRVFTADGARLDERRFKVMYGQHDFALDADGVRSTDSAWKAFTQSQGREVPKADCACFRPTLKPGEMIKESGLTKVNTYTPRITPRQAGDASLFLEHLRRLLPKGDDMEIVVSYLAACVQYPGVKFQWALLIQGCYGNGKSLILKCMERAIGEEYTHRLNAQELAGSGLKFNRWIRDKLLIVIDEVYVQRRWEAKETLKTYITETRIEIQAKGENQVTGENRANFLMCSNHKDALVKEHADRRYCICYTAQQSKADLQTWGMDGEYFGTLFDWLRHRNGFAIVNNLLRTYQIPDKYNPTTGAHIAPETTSTQEAIDISRGPVESAIQDAIQEGRTGFRGGWISSVELGVMLANRGLDKQAPQNRRRLILAKIGYTPHPGLPDGRSTVPILPHGKKSRLYITEGHLSTNLTAYKAVVDAYVKAQDDTAPVNSRSARRQI